MVVGIMVSFKLGDNVTAGLVGILCDKRILPADFSFLDMDHYTIGFAILADVVVVLVFVASLATCYLVFALPDLVDLYNYFLQSSSAT